MCGMGTGDNKQALLHCNQFDLMHGDPLPTYHPWLRHKRIEFRCNVQFASDWEQRSKPS